jgi:hypothetical protein
MVGRPYGLPLLILRRGEQRIVHQRQRQVGAEIDDEEPRRTVGSLIAEHEQIVGQRRSFDRDRGSAEFREDGVGSSQRQ